MPEWTEVPAGIIDGANKRFWPAIGDQADVVAKRINTDAAYLARVAQFAIDGKAEHVVPVSMDLARLVPPVAHMIADLRGQLAGERGFEVEQFDSLTISRPLVGNFPVVLPVAYMENLKRTVEYYVEVLKRRYPAFWRWPELGFGPNSLRVWSPNEKKFEWPAGTVRMVGLDLLANCDPKDGTTVEENRTKENAPMPGVEILALMALAPALGQAMDGGVVNGGKMPYLDLAGLEANVSGFDPWSFAPVVCYVRGCRELRLNGRHVDVRSRDCASPAFRECQ